MTARFSLATLGPAPARSGGGPGQALPPASPGPGLPARPPPSAPSLSRAAGAILRAAAREGAGPKGRRRRASRGAEGSGAGGGPKAGRAAPLARGRCLGGVGTALRAVPPSAVRHQPGLFPLVRRLPAAGRFLHRQSRCEITAKPGRWRCLLKERAQSCRCQGWR